MPQRLLSRLVLIFMLALAPLVAAAQDGGEKVTLVLDASGSMWGQIDGEAKITIARRAVEGLLDSLPDSTQLGLTAYGHREKGNCDDIETLVAPGPGTRPAIRQAIAGLNPKGKTPLSKAVQMAAEELKFEENKATVILISDGIETCEYDPCALGRQLEETGVDFTAHVIGFDVAEADARAQLQCLAENTGGRYLSADSADELAAALEEVSVTPAPEPAPATVDALFEATDGKDGPVIKSGLLWTLSAEGAEAALLDGLDIGVLRMPLAPGKYTASVRRADGAGAELQVEIAPEAGNSFTLPIIVALPEASVSAAAEAALGATIPVTWTGPDEARDYISVAKVGADGGEYINYTYTETGNPLKLQMPPQPGEYEIRYILSQNNQMLASVPVTVVPVEVSVSAAAEAPQGATIPVTWTGPDEARDYISVAKVGADGGEYINYTYTETGNPLKLQMPPQPGEYEIRYILSQNNQMLASVPVTVVPVEVSVSAAAEAPQGATIPVTWTGPDEPRDYISVAKVGADGGEYINYTYTETGNPLKLQMPPQPGEYEIRYILSQNNQMLASVPVTVTKVAVSVSAVASAPAESEIIVTWTGPDAARDYIAIARPDADDGAYETYSYTEQGNPLSLALPATPGAYEIRYVLSQNNTVLARQPITVE